jgi:hypothetical protein
VWPLRAGSDASGRSSSRFEGGRVLNDPLPPIAPDTPNGQSFARLQVRHDDVHDAKVCACGEQDEFDGHARQYIFSRMYVCCRVKSVIPALHQALQIYPSKQAILKPDRTSRLGHFRTYAMQQKEHIHHLVGADEQYCWRSQPV